MRVLFDTNVIVDVIAERQPFYADSYAVFYKAARREIIGIVPAGAVTDIYYLTNKSFPDSTIAQTAISDLLNILYAVDTRADDVRTALGYGFRDFEDAVISAVAERENADLIITRNISDFKTSPVKAISPKDFLRQIS